MPGYNVLDMDNIPKTEWTRYNAEWLNTALRRGDQIWLRTDPAARSAYLIKKYGTDQESLYFNTELLMLEHFSGVDIFENFAPLP